ncbi:hypothetical protein V9L05_18810 [Bernardetia sp. Wsw4-3y2]|uniref:hypothetical protein n=1 Tax=Bernardetia sp. Wsw4-3y2 TaxID=3127471 RepID=UPI0030D181CC
MASFPSLVQRACAPGLGYLAQAALTACKRYQPSDIAAIIPIERDYVFTDDTDDAEWATAQTAGSLDVIPVRGTLNQPTGNKIDGYGGKSQKMVDMSHSLTSRFPNPDGNYGIVMQELKNNPDNYGVIIVFRDLACYVILDHDLGHEASLEIDVMYAGDQAERQGTLDLFWKNNEFPYLLEVPKTFLRTAIKASLAA